MPPHSTMKPHWFHILLCLADSDRHGTAIMEEVLERTEHGIRLWPGKLYGALRDLAEEGLIVEVDAPGDAPTEGGKRRFYSITSRGRGALSAEVTRLASIVRLAEARGAGPSTA